MLTPVIAYCRVRHSLVQQGNRAWVTCWEQDDNQSGCQLCPLQICIIHLYDLQEDDDPTTAAAPEEEEQPHGKAGPGPKSSKSKKRSGEDIIEREKERSKKAKEDANKKAEWFELKQNTSVYVSGLPSDVTEEEVAQVNKNPLLSLSI